MKPWFENKLSRKDVRKYTKNQIKKNKLKNITRKYSATTWIIIINVAVFILTTILMLIFQPEEVIKLVALQPNAFFRGGVWQIFTSMFLHIYLTHLFVNMISLFFLGNFIERIIGRKRFITLYLLSGIIAGLMFVVLAYLFGSTELGARIFGSPEIFAMGASGAIFALGGLLAVLTPNMKVYIFFVIPMKMWLAMVVLLGGFWIASIFGDLPIGNTAHFGGLIVGVAYGYYLKRKYKRKTKMIQKVFG